MTFFMLPLWAQAPTGQQDATAAAELKSQPGAVGQALPVAQAPVPVPPGPVAPANIKPAPPTPIAVKKVELGDEENWDPQWDVLIEENLPPELLDGVASHDVKPFCPRFSQLSEPDKRAFWAYFFQALAGAEAGLKPTTEVRHTQPEVAVLDTVSHRTVRQEGLLQLTYMDSDRYGCNFDWEADKGLPEHDPNKTILQPKNNLLCGIRILKNQLIDLDKPLLTPNSYWSTLRPGTVSYRVFAKQMANVPMACAAKPAGSRKAVEPPQLREAYAKAPETETAGMQ
jgi:hypothetical protein